MNSRGNKIYFDYQSTTPVDPRVRDEIVRVMTNVTGNPMSNHFAGKEARGIVDASRKQIAELIGALPEEIVFTSGATESINMAIKGLAFGLRDHGNHIITSTIEHKAVLETLSSLENEGFRISYVHVDTNGFIDLDELAGFVSDDTILMAFGHANNEIGTIQDIAQISKIASDNNIHLFSDCAQSFGKEEININQLNSMAFSGHKIYGPKGIGALYIEKKWRNQLKKTMHGGGQEYGLRAGTHNVPSIAGFAKAAEIAFMEKDQHKNRLIEMRNKLWSELNGKIIDLEFNGPTDHRLANNLNFSLPTIPNELIFNGLSGRFAFSSGSACMTDSELPSHVIRSLGKSSDIANSAIRISLGRYTTWEEINSFQEEFISVVNKIQRIRNF